MKKDNRVKLYIYKQRPNGILDLLDVIVMKDKKQAAVEKCKSEGWTVTAVDL